VVLRALTVNVARMPGVHDLRGAIQPGMAADLIATQVKPLDNITALKEVRFVMKDGRVIRHN